MGAQLPMAGWFTPKFRSNATVNGSGLADQAIAGRRHSAAH
jgi:hypothetical protein